MIAMRENRGQLSKTSQHVRRTALYESITHN